MKRRRFISGAATGALCAGVPAGATAAPANDQGRTGARRRRVLFVAVDGMDAAMIRRYAGDLPNMRRMMAEGYSGRILPYVSCWGNIDFMSMLTGATVGTQYRERMPDGGEPPHRQCVAETIWQVLTSDGRRSLLLDFPGARPGLHTATIQGFTLQGGTVYQTADVQLEGAYRKGLETTGWPPGGGPRPGRRWTVVETPKAAFGWPGLPASNRPPLETAAGPWYALVLAAGSAYDTVAVFDKRAGREIARTRAGVWSDWGEVRWKGRDARVRFHLLEAAAGGRRVQLLQSPVVAADGFSEPAGLAPKLVADLGPPTSGSAIPPTPFDPFWETGEAEALGGAMWAAEAAAETLKLWDWDFFLYKASLTDAAMHQCLTLADPSYHSYDPEIGRRADAVQRRAFADMDRFVGRLLEVAAASGDTAVVVASDHGGGVNNVVCDVNRLLEQAGLLAMEGGEIAWSRTRAYTKRNRQGTEIFINLKGREPGGIVEPSGLEAAQEEVIDALLGWRGPIGSKRAIAYALKLRDAALLGYWGPEAGDVQFCYNPGFVWGVNPGGEAIARSTSPIANHGPQIVTAETGYSSMMGQLLAWGPGVARGVRRDELALGPVPIASVAPTVSRLLACRKPRQSQLGVIEEMLA